MQPAQIQPYMLSNEEGQLLQSLGALVSIKATSEQTGGVFNLFEVPCPPGFATPLHIHYTEEVTIYILEGALSIYWGSGSRMPRPVRISTSRAVRRMDFGRKPTGRCESYT